MDGKSRAGSALILTALLALFVVGAASPASAATISPTDGNFGRVLIGKQSPVRTYTVTIGSEARWPISAGAFGSFVSSGTSISFGEVQNGSPTECSDSVTELNAARPSCTISAFFAPTVPGPQRGAVFANDPDGPDVQLTGIAVIPRGNFYCRKGPGGKFISHKKVTRWCQK